MAQTVARRTPGIDQEVLNYLMMLQQRQSVPNYLDGVSAPADEARVGAGQYGLPYTPPLPQQAGPNELERAQAAMTPGQAALRLIAGGAQTGPERLADPRQVGEAVLMTAPIPGAGAVGRAVSGLRSAARTVAPVVRRASVPVAAGGLGVTAIPSMAGDKPSDAVKTLQIKMRDAGYYKGKIDGIMGGETESAKAAFDKAEAKRLEQETERARIESERLGKQAVIEETARQGKADETKKKQREEGEKRLREMDKDKSEFWASYGTPLTYGAGILAGALSRGAATALTNRAARKSANELSALVGGGGDLPLRVGGVNTFWKRGGASELPFNPAPKGRYGFKSNKQAPSAPTLYNEKPGNKYVRAGDYGAMGFFGAEMGVSEWQKIGAREELRQAREAVSADPSEPNIRRMKAAEDEYAFWEGMANAGRGAMGGYGGVGKFATYKNPRPNAAAAEAERIRIDNIIHQARPIRSQRKK